MIKNNWEELSIRFATNLEANTKFINLSFTSIKGISSAQVYFFHSFINPLKMLGFFYVPCIELEAYSYATNLILTLIIFNGYTISILPLKNLMCK